MALTAVRRGFDVFHCTTLCALAIALALFSTDASAQTDGQLWADLTLYWKASVRQTVGLNVEPRVMVVVPPADEGWVELGISPSYMFTWKAWLDVGSEVYAAYTVQNDDLKSLELTPRLDVELHLLSRDWPELLLRELQPKRKIVLVDLVRVELRNLFYNNDTPESSTVRFRNRLQIQMPLNKDRMTTDGVTYVSADWEWFIPLGDPAERFAKDQTVRAGFGHRRNFNWNFEGLFVWQRSRNTAESGFSTSSYAVDIRINRRF